MMKKTEDAEKVADEIAGVDEENPASKKRSCIKCKIELASDNKLPFCPACWEEITGYEYEPWHVRYVGKENARRIHEQEMPLEEYLQIVRNERLLGIVEGTYLGEVEVEESGE